MSALSRGYPDLHDHLAALKAKNLLVTVDETLVVAGVTLPKKLTVHDPKAEDATPLQTVTISGAEGNPKLEADTFKVPEGKDLPKQGEGGDDEGDDK